MNDCQYVNAIGFSINVVDDPIGIPEHLANSLILSFGYNSTRQRKSFQSPRRIVEARGNDIRVVRSNLHVVGLDCLNSVVRKRCPDDGGHELRASGATTRFKLSFYLILRQQPLASLHLLKSGLDII